jgi:hypothetical protein
VGSAALPGRAAAGRGRHHDSEHYHEQLAMHIVTIPQVVVITEWNELRRDPRDRISRSQNPPIWDASWSADRHATA